MKFRHRSEVFVKTIFFRCFVVRKQNRPEHEWIFLVMIAQIIITND